MAMTLQWFFLLAMPKIGESTRPAYTFSESSDASTAAHEATDHEKAAQALVASLIQERSNAAQVVASSDGFFQWIPASSLEAQQGEQTRKEAEQEVREEFEKVLGKDLVGVFESDFAAIKKELEPTFQSLPKNEYGELGHTAVRYALHRIFVARHGWYIQGLDPEGSHFNTSSPAEVLAGRVPDHVQQLIEKILYGRGFGLSEVALLGALLENMIHQEAIERTQKVFELFDMDIKEMVSAEKADFAIDNFMAAYILGQDITKMNKRRMTHLYEGMDKVYPNWQVTRQWTRKLRQDRYGDKTLTFTETVAVIVDIGEKHGSWQNHECLDLKAKLMNLEVQKNGCVPVSNFYTSLKDGKWQFSESPDYLRELGALDESEPDNLKVMIPNYLDGASNCVASSTYYSVCCINEGEEILGRIEKHIQKPDATPEELARLVAALPSSTVPAKRTLPPSLVQRLEKIAVSHGGRVPIHSRLFMQWMHNAYPHEVPYPHVSGKTAPRSPEEWMHDSHKDPTVTEAEVAGFAKHASASMAHGNGQCGKWLDEEELYVPWKVHPADKELENDAHAWFFTTTIGLICAVASMMLMLIQSAKSFWGATDSSKTSMISLN